jgi:hypothetical protein
LQELQADSSTLFPPRGSVRLCVAFAGQVVSIEHQVWLYSEVDEHPHAVHGIFDMPPGGLALSELDGTGNNAAVEPTIGIDAYRFTGEVA